MLVVTPFHPGDADQALRLFRWISEIDAGLPPKHDLLLIADTRCSPAVVADIEAAAREGFRNVQTLPFVDHFRRWPDSANACFSAAARHIMANQRVPWLMLEPDCVPLRAGWRDDIEHEYDAAVRTGKWFMGARVEVADVPLHMSGNAVYPADMFAHAGNTLIAGDVPWDMTGKDQIVPQAHFTKLITHAWRRDSVTKEPLNLPFVNQGDLDNLLGQHPEAVLYHADKSGTLIERLRERKNNLSGGVESSAEASVSERHAVVGIPGHAPVSVGPRQDSGSSAPPAQNFTCDIFVKSYPKDYERLRYCLRSIEKFASGFRRVVLVVPFYPEKGIFPPGMGDPLMKIVELKESGEPYLFQQTVKANAHEYSDADYFLHLDSDCLLTRPITPETFFRDGCPLWLMTPYASIQAGIDAQKAADPNFYCGSMTWKIITEKFLGEPVEHEYMRRMPMFTPRSLHVAAAEFCKLKHGKSLSEYILSQPAKEFSEFNALGALAYSRARDDFFWLDTTKEPLPESVCIQKWSHEPFSAETKTEFERILAPLPAHPMLGVESPAESRLTNADLEAAAGVLIPWHDTEHSMHEIRSLARSLQQFCTGGAKTRMVREELHRLGIVELPYRNKKRKGWKRRKKRA